MHDLSNMSDAELLRAAVQDAERRPNTRDLELSQIFNGLVKGNPELENLWFELTSKIQASVTFHLDGTAIKEHSVEAPTVVSLIRGITDATMKTAQHRLTSLRQELTSSGKANLKAKGGRPLLVTPFAPGSFEFAIETQPIPDEDLEVENQSEADLRVPITSMDDEALLDVIEVLYSDGNGVQLEKLPHSAQRALLEAAQVMTDDSVTVTATVVQRNRRRQEWIPSHSAASDLVRELVADRTVNKNLQGTFRFDGYKESDQSAYLLVEKHSKKFLVNSPDLLSRLRTFPASGDETWIECDYTISVTRAAGKKTKTEFLLTYAKKVPKPLKEEAAQYAMDLLSLLDELTEDDD